MLEIFLLMLATSVHQAAEMDAALSMPAETPSITALEAPTATAPDSAQMAEEETPPAAAEPAPPQQTSALNLPVFPPAASTAPAQPAPVATAPQPAPQTAAPVIFAPQPAPQPVPQPTPNPQEQTSAQLAFLAPKAQTVTPGLVAEPQVPTGRFLTALEVRPILNATKSNWIAVREYGGKDLLYVTHLWSWRCGLLELRVGLNGAPAEPWPLPQCHLDKPQAAAILEGDGNPYREFPLRTVQLIEVMVTYDDLTTDRVRFNRAGVVIP